MIEQTLVLDEDGNWRGVVRDALVCHLLTGQVPQRASRIEPIDAPGPYQGLFHVDCSPLAELTARPELAVCLTRTFADYEAARRAEVAWLEEHFLFTE